MRSTQEAREARAFACSVVDRLRCIDFETLHSWPDYPEQVPFELDVPDTLSKWTFTIMKDQLDARSVRVSIQFARLRAFGMFASISADGFIIFPDGERRELSEEDLWDLT